MKTLYYFSIAGLSP